VPGCRGAVQDYSGALCATPYRSQFSATAGSSDCLFARVKSMLHLILQALGVGLFLATLWSALQFEGMGPGMSYARAERRLRFKMRFPGRAARGPEAVWSPQGVHDPDPYTRDP
jgi:hypothetical protein